MLRLSGSHVAHLDHVAGCGLLVLPHAADDVPDRFPTAAAAGSTLPPGARVSLSLGEAAWADAMRQLDRLGWELSEDDDGGPLTVGTTADGREVLALYGRDAITSAPSLAEIGASLAALQAAAGVLPTQRDGRAHDTV